MYQFESAQGHEIELTNVFTQYRCHKIQNGRHNCEKAVKIRYVL